MLLALLGCQRSDQTPGPASDGPARFVGSTTCASCHPRETEAHRGSHHARAMQVADAASVLGDFAGARFTDHRVVSTFLRRDGKYVVRTEGADGKPADFDVAYTFGVWPLQQYLLPLAGGRLQALTIAWDSRPPVAGGQRWYSLYPGERFRPDDPLHWSGREQTWNYQCAECHVTDLRKNFDLAQNRYATRWAELGVNCEACHGPGSAHAAWARTRKPGAGRGESALVVALHRPEGAWEMKDAPRGIAQWSGPSTRRARGEAEVDACARCHARRRPIVDPYPYGRPFLETHQPALLVDGLYHADGQILGEVYEYGSFLQSRMRRAGVTCSDCHEPHALRLRADGNALCGSCHLPARFDSPAHHHHPTGSDGARCVSCHMPARTYMGVDARRDHGFRVPRPDLTVTVGTPNPCGGCHAGRSAAWAMETIRAWHGPGWAPRPSFASALDAGRRASLDAASQLATLATDRGEPGIARATALALLPGFPGSRAFAAIEAGLGDVDPLVRSAAVGALEGLPLEHRANLAAPALRDPVRAVRLAAARVLAGARGSLSADQQVDFDRALSELVASELVSADRPEAHLNLANLYARLGRPADTESELRTALWLDPRFVPAMVNLADLFRAQGRDRDGERFLEQALRIEPESAEAMHSLGLLRVRQGRPDEGVAWLRRAAARRPDIARFGYVYAVALYSTGQASQAIAVLEDLHRKRPADRDVLTALATYWRERGEVARALGYADTLVALVPEDPAARALRDDLRRRAGR